MRHRAIWGIVGTLLGGLVITPLALSVDLATSPVWLILLNTVIWGAAGVSYGDLRRHVLSNRPDSETDHDARPDDEPTSAIPAPGDD